MLSQIKTGLKRRSGALVFPLVAVAVLGFMQTSFLSAYQSSPAGEQEKSGAEIIQNLKIASMQYDLILLLIENKNFDRVEPEWKKVLALKLSDKYEGAVAQSLLAIGYKLSEAKQLALALQILDDSLASVPFSNKNKADVLRFKAYLYKEAGDLDKAIETLRQAGELAKKP